jgi:hypothetical protein
VAQARARAARPIVAQACPIKIRDRLSIRNGSCAQIAVIGRRLGEPVKSTYIRAVAVTQERSTALALVRKGDDPLREESLFRLWLRRTG